VDYDLSIVMKTGIGMGFNKSLTVAEATGGAGFYADFSTGPSYLQNMGANGMESFFYILTDNKTFRKSGQGRITRNLENYQY